jgi:predicted secreted acid phosphatase
MFVMSQARYTAGPTVLDRVLARCRGANAVAVFDLDSTVLDNRPRQARILREFGLARNIAALKSARPEHWQGWSIERAMTNAGVAAAEAAALADEAKQFWRERFFTSEYCCDDDAILGASEYLREVVAAGARIAYCTGRHEAMRKGTLESFARLGFPTPDARESQTRVQLLMKPLLEFSDDAWKESAYEMLRTLGSVEAVFDNEPTHLNGYRAAFADAIIVHLMTDDSGRKVALSDGIVSIRNFAR